MLPSARLCPAVVFLEQGSGCWEGLGDAQCGFGSWHLTGGKGVAVWPGLQRASRLAFMSRVQCFSNDI